MPFEFYRSTTEYRWPRCKQKQDATITVCLRLCMWRITDWL